MFVQFNQESHINWKLVHVHRVKDTCTESWWGHNLRMNWVEIYSVAQFVMMWINMTWLKTGSYCITYVKHMG